ncbi:MAG: hypothetical protein PQ275_29120 [Elizabethkingia anophelis]|nr:MAG: hypothetical protein PQ275_29120 [Elizabethkingia anophelis]
MKKAFKNAETYYDVLGIPMDASSDEIKKAGRKLISQYHPDTNKNNPDYNPESFFQVHDAYETLRDEEKRRIYNETHLIVAKARTLIKRPENSEEWDEAFRKAIIKRIISIEEKLSVQETFFQ